MRNEIVKIVLQGMHRQELIQVGSGGDAIRRVFDSKIYWRYLTRKWSKSEILNDNMPLMCL